MLFTHLNPSDVPTTLITEEFVLRPIVAADAELDYAAVMESRVFLRPWEQTGWPSDDFTLQENIDDVVGLEQRHQERRAFTYTVLSPDESTCLGCVYVMPPDARHYQDVRIHPSGSAEWLQFGAVVSFWVRSSLLAGGLDQRVLDAVRSWLPREGNLGRLLFSTNERVTPQVDLLSRTDLRQFFTIEKPGHSGAYLAYG